MISNRAIGTSMLFINDAEEILLLLRDNIPSIRYPNMWDIPGGNLEGDESPEDCIRREMAEELGVTLSNTELFEKREFDDRTEYTFWQRANLEIPDIRLTEGQRLAWFNASDAMSLELAFGFNQTIESFFREKPWALENQEGRPQLNGTETNSVET